MNFIKLTRRSVNRSTVNIVFSPQSRFFQTSQNLLLSQGGGESKSRSLGAEMIRLYDQNGKSIGHKSKQEAEMIAKKNGLILVAMEILGKPKFPEYQMKPRHEVLTANDELNECDESDPTKETADHQVNKDSKKMSNVQKDIKRITFETGIASNDLKVKIDQIRGQIEKN